MGGAPPLPLDFAPPLPKKGHFLAILGGAPGAGSSQATGEPGGRDPPTAAAHTQGPARPPGQGGPPPWGVPRGPEARGPQTDGFGGAEQAPPPHPYAERAG